MKPTPLVLLAAVALPIGAWAQVETQAPPAAQVEKKAEGPPRNFLNFRVGATSFNPEHPELCLEGSPLAFLAIESCGNGAGFLHNDPAPEIAHFRAKYRLTSWQTRYAWLQPQVGLGFAELQIGEDAPGFHFTGTGPNRTATAGPELGFGLKALVPAGDLFELIGEVNVSGAWFQHAPALEQPMQSFQPTATFTLGVGF